MIRSGGTEAGARRRGLHVSGVFELKRNHHKTGIVYDKYTDNTKDPQRGKISRACFEALAWGAGKSLQDMITEGIAMGNWR